jgi:hypothetical protein
MITTRLIYRIYSRKNAKEMCQKMVAYPCISLATNPTNLGIMLQSTTSRPPFSVQSVSTRPPDDLLLVDLFNLLSITSTSTSTLLVNHFNL